MRPSRVYRGASTLVHVAGTGLRAGVAESRGRRLEMSRGAGGVREFVSRSAAGLRSGSWPFTWGVLAALVCAGMGRLEPALGEEGLILHGVQRMLHGERLYADMI